MILLARVGGSQVGYKSEECRALFQKVYPKPRPWCGQRIWGAA